MNEEYVLRAGLDSRGFVQGANEVQGAITRVQTGANMLRNALAALGVALSVQKIIQVNTEFERLGAQLETVTGSIQGAGIAFRELERFAAQTPFQLNEVVEAFTQLKARGLDPSIESMTAWGDLASSMGRSVGDAIRAVGAATVGEMEALKSFGIQASQAGDKVSFTFKGTTELVDRNARSIEDYLRRLAQSNFAGSMERQSRTLGGAFSNLEDAVAAVMRSIGTGGFNDALKDTVRLLTDVANASKDAASSMGSFLGDALKTATDIAARFGDVYAFMRAIGREADNRSRAGNRPVQSIEDIPDRALAEGRGILEAYSALAGIVRMIVGAGVSDIFTRMNRATATLEARNGGSVMNSDAERADIVQLAALRQNDPFKPEVSQSASAQLSTLRGNLERQAAFSGIVGPMGDLLKQLGDAQTGLNTQQLIAFARTGALPETSRDFTTGSRDALLDARRFQMAIYQAERDREEQGRDIGIRGSNERAAGFASGNVRAIEEATAAEKARQAVLKDGRNFDVEYRRQLEELDARNKESATQRLAQTEQQTAATQRLLDAVRSGSRDTSELEARNEALAAAAENSQVNVDKLTEALVNNRRAAAQLDYERAMRQLDRTTEAAGKYQIVLNRITLEYEVQNRELEIANRLTDDLIAKYGADDARRMVEAQVDAAEAQRKVQQEAERTRLRVEANDWTTGAMRGLRRYQDTALNMANTVENAVVNAFQGMEDAMVKFVKTGKLDFASLADSIISDLIRIQVRAAMAQVLGGAGEGGGGLFGGLVSALGGGIASMFGGGAFPEGAGLGGGGNIPWETVYGGSGILPGDFAFAKGAAFSRGRVIPFAKGGVRHHPTFFPMANGNVGLMAEAGPEAIMPLGRDSSGRLGVRAQGGGGAVVQIIDQRSSSAPPVETQQSTGPDGRQQIRVLIREETSSLMRAGSFDRTMRDTFNVNRSPFVR